MGMGFGDMFSGKTDREAAENRSSSMENKAERKQSRRQWMEETKRSELVLVKQGANFSFECDNKALNKS